MFAKIDAAIAAVRKGEMVVLVDSQSRENEGDLVLSAEKVTPEAINFMVTHARGLVCMPMQGEDLDRLSIPLMDSRNPSRFRCAFTVSIDAASDISTGISAADRARTISIAADPNSQVEDLTVPGHIFPLRAHPQGILGRQGHTEGSIALMEMAGLRPASVICEVMKADGEMARTSDLIAFTQAHGLHLVAMDELLSAYQQFSGVADVA